MNNKLFEKLREVATVHLIFLMALDVFCNTMKLGCELKNILK